MAYSLTGLAGFGTILSESSSKDAQLFQMPIPTQDSNQTIVLDIFGTVRNITLNGVYTSTDTDYATIQDFVVAVDKLVDGAQLTTKKYISDKSGLSYNVIVQTVRWDSSEAEINKVNYEITMMEALKI